jgi:hypothetical protein
MELNHSDKVCKAFAVVKQLLMKSSSQPCSHYNECTLVLGKGECEQQRERLKACQVITFREYMYSGKCIYRQKDAGMYLQVRGRRGICLCTALVGICCCASENVSCGLYAHIH